MQFLNFTPQEIKALLFLLIALLIGSGITIYKKSHPNFAPELIFDQNSLGSFENQSQSSKDLTDTESHFQEVSHKISKSPMAFPISNQQKGKQTLSIHENPLLKIPPKAGKKKIDLNSASASELELLPQIGPVLSQRIINYRNTKGKFQKIEDILKVPGIGPKTLDKIKELVTAE